MNQEFALSLLVAVSAAACGSKEQEHKHEQHKPTKMVKEEYASDINEARRVLTTMLLAAELAYDRQTLCKSSTSVPAKPPKAGERVKIEGEEWGGNETTGWKCLGFTLNADPAAMQYSYTQGGPYKSKERGGPDLGPAGVEVCAEADFHEGGDTTLICRQAKVNEGTKALIASDGLLEYFEK